MVTPLQIQTFGGLSLILDGRALTFDAHSAEALLVYLACQRRPISREALAELFWPERSQQQARTNLRGALHRLRQPLEPYLLVTRQSVALQPAAALALDCAHFESHLAAGQLADAMTLYQGDFLVNFYLDGSPAFEQWALLERERLRTLAISAAQQLIRQLTAAGQVDLAIAGAQRLLQLDPLHEPTHRQLMLLLAQAGQRSAALAQFETCRHLFRQELDIPPDAATTALYEQIRANDIRFAILDFGLSTPPDGDAIPKSKACPGRIQNPKLNNLPPQPTPFIGREPELAQIAALLANPDCRLLSLLGSGGMGKTRLAVEAAARQVDRFADGVCFVPLAAVSAPEFLLGAIAQSLSITLRDDDLVMQVVNHLRGRQLLLVLDNFEHLLETADVVATLVRSAPRLKVLVTTRSRLQLIEEWLLPVDGLPCDNDPHGAAAQLFLRSAQRVQPTFSAGGQSEMIATICRQVGGMPLAIELAASWVRLMSCREIARQLGHNFDLLNTPLRNLPERHRSLRVLFDQSWRLLTKPEQEMLMGLSVFQGGWTLDEAETVCVDGQADGANEPSLVNRKSKIVNLLLALVDKSFVRSNGENRYDLHELVRQYAAEHLTRSGVQETICQRHFATYLALARTADSHLRGPNGREWFQRLEREQGNIRTALRWATDHGHGVQVAWMGFALSCFWTRRARFTEAVAWLEPLLDQAKSWPVELRLTHLLNLSGAWTGALNYQDIDHHAGELMALAEACNNKILYADALFILAMSEPAVSQAAKLYARAIALVRQSVESFVGDCANYPADKVQGSVGLSAEFGQFGDTVYLLANLLLDYGHVLRRQGEYTQATAYYQESLALFRAQGERDMIASPLGALGCMALTHGDLVAAQCYIGEAVTIVQAVGNALDSAHWHACLALVKLYVGNVEEAWQLLQVCLLHNELRQTFFARKAQLVAGMIALERKEFTSAEAFLRDSLAAYRLDRVIYPDLADCLFTAARLAAAQQHYKRAATLFGLAERLRVELRHTLDAPARPLIDAALATVQAALEPAAFAEVFAVGQGMTLAEALITVAK